ncbi:MAG TPA: DUF3617 family protein [Caulobacteraceae bacterium]
MRWTVVCCLAGAALLAGCGKHQGAQAPSGAAAPAPTAMFGRPHPKPGLWRTDVTTNMGPGVSMTGELCLDASNEDAAFSSNGHGFSKDCEPIKYQAADGGVGFSTVCHIGKRTVTTSGTATGDFKNAYSVDLSTRMDPPPPGLPAQMSTTIRAKWEGPCPPGQKPGQVSMKLSGFGQG